MSFKFLYNTTDFYWKFYNLFSSKSSQSITNDITVNIKTFFSYSGKRTPIKPIWSNFCFIKRLVKMYTKYTVTQFIPKTLARMSGGDGYAYRNLLGDSLLSVTVSGSALVRSTMWFLKWQMAFKPMKSCILKAQTSILIGGQA